MSRTKKTFPFFLWHRRFGLVGLLLIVILSVTGIMLNHTEQFGLDESIVESDLLLDWYDLNPKGKPVSYAADSNTVTQWSGQLFFNNAVLLTSREKLRGAVVFQGMVVIALNNMLLLVDSAGELIEKLSDINGVKDIRHIGLKNNSVIVETASGKMFVADEQIISWTADSQKNVNWSAAIELNSGQAEKIKQVYRGKGLTLERIVIDLHSGRIFSASWGVYIMDLAAIIMILLGISGAWVWWTRYQKMKSKRHYQKHHNR